jgi:hypothetical protein
VDELDVLAEGEIYTGISTDAAGWMYFAEGLDVDDIVEIGLMIAS